MNACLILIENQDKQRLPDPIQAHEIFPTAERIPSKWHELASLTKLFEPHEIADIACCRSNENESRKAFNMLNNYIERGSTREKLADALEKLKISTLAQDVLYRYFISDH